MRTTVCSNKVDLPIPGSPPIRVIEPGTMPPPSTRLSSLSAVRMRGSSLASTCDRAIGWGLLRSIPVRAWRARRSVLMALGLSGRITISFMVFHAPHEGHLPTHLGESMPHSEQTYTVFDFATCDSICAMIINAYGTTTGLYTKCSSLGTTLLHSLERTFHGNEFFFYLA